MTRDKAGGGKGDWGKGRRAYRAWGESRKKVATRVHKRVPNCQPDWAGVSGRGRKGREEEGVGGWGKLRRSSC